jgi:hypothetical protein
MLWVTRVDGGVEIPSDMHVSTKERDRKMRKQNPRVATAVVSVNPLKVR